MLSQRDVGGIICQHQWSRARLQVSRVVPDCLRGDSGAPNAVASAKAVSLEDKWHALEQNIRGKHVRFTSAAHCDCIGAFGALSICVAEQFRRLRSTFADGQGSRAENLVSELMSDERKRFWSSLDRIRELNSAVEVDGVEHVFFSRRNAAAMRVQCDWCCCGQRAVGSLCTTSVFAFMLCHDSILIIEGCSSCIGHREAFEAEHRNTSSD